MEEIFYGLEFHCLKWSNYFEQYEKYFKKFKDAGIKPRVLEIGVKHGGGIELLHKYFGGGKYYGIDCWVDSTEIDFAKHGIDCTMFLGDQSDFEWWKKWLKENPNLRFDIIIDDGSHIANHQYLSLVTLFHRLSEDGIYVIEDVHTSFFPAKDEKTKMTYGLMGEPSDRQFYTIGLPNLVNVQYFSHLENKVDDEYNSLKKRILDYGILSYLQGLSGIHLELGQIFIEKKFIEIPHSVYSDGTDRVFPENVRTIWGIIEHPNPPEYYKEMGIDIEKKDNANKNTNQWEF